MRYDDILYIVEYFSKTEQRMKNYQFDSLKMAEAFYNGLKDYDGKYLSKLQIKAENLQTIKEEGGEQI